MLLFHLIIIIIRDIVKLFVFVTMFLVTIIQMLRHFSEKPTLM